MRGHAVVFRERGPFRLRAGPEATAAGASGAGLPGAAFRARPRRSRLFSPRARSARAIVTRWSCPERFRGSGGHAFQSVADPMCAGRTMAGFVRRRIRARFERRSMRQKFLTALAFWGCAFGLATGQDPTPAPATAAEIQELRQQVQALTEMVKTLQQQVQDQQAASAARIRLPQNPEPPELAGLLRHQRRARVHLRCFRRPTQAWSRRVQPAAPAGLNANGTAFPTSDAAVTTTADSSAVGSALHPANSDLRRRGGKTYMNISFDGMFALAGFERARSRSSRSRRSRSAAARLQRAQCRDRARRRGRSVFRRLRQHRAEARQR